MNGITHMEDLSPGEILHILDSEWVISEKLDGTYFEFGLDELGKFYSRRKGGPACYSIDDWPEENWTRDFRPAHRMADRLIGMYQYHHELSGPLTLRAEIIGQTIQNTIPYILDRDGVMVITDSSDLPLSEQEKFLGIWTLGAHLDFQINEIWKVKINPSMNRSQLEPETLLKLSSFRDWLVGWLSQPSGMADLDIRRVLESNLNKRPHDISVEVWRSMRPDLKETRALLRNHLREQVKALKLSVLDEILGVLPTAMIEGGMKEGLVARTPQLMFKMTDREAFARANTFTHIVKYWLTGGRRPARPCFLSRTKDWSVDARLARLDVLEKRFETHKARLVYDYTNNGHVIDLSYEDLLYERTIRLFEDVRGRIKNGR